MLVFKQRTSSISRANALHKAAFGQSFYTSTSTTSTTSIVLLMLILMLHNTCTAVPELTSWGVQIVRSPESVVAPKGDEVLFECELNLSPERLEWRFRHLSLQAANGTTHFQYLKVENGCNITNEERSSKLRIFVSLETLGDYQCVAWFGSAAIASTSARLTLVSISINNSITNSRNNIRWSVAPRNCILIRCGTVQSNPPAVWSFYRNGEKVPTTGLTSSNGALILSSVSSKDSGNYTCSAMNPISGVEVKLQQRVEVHVDYMDRAPPYFLFQPQTKIMARSGEAAILECPGVGSPPPESVWSRPNGVNIYNNRTNVLSYGLQITNVSVNDQGTYVCRLDNGIAPALVHVIELNVLDRPKIVRGPVTTLTNEGDPLYLECLASGNPPADIYWLINGEDTSTDNEIFQENNHLIIQHVQKRHAGIVQCFAKNEAGEASDGNLLQVNPKQINGEESLPFGNEPIRAIYEHFGNKNKSKRKHTKMLNMIPPSRPNVTRLSDDSVMLRWYVPRNDGLPIQFFKVQYRMLGDSMRKIPRENWQTTNEDIRFGKGSRNFEGATKNFTSSVSGLKPDRYYRFRIIAVYSNNDNKEGNTSVKFFLQRGSALGASKSNLPAPELLRIETLSESAVTLYWRVPKSNANSIMGFYVYYRPTSSAGEYLKATVDGMDARSLDIDLLEPGTAYEFKVQSFNMQAASEFSAILQGKTKKILVPTKSTVDSTKTSNEKEISIYPVMAGVVGGGILLLIAIIAACLCIKRRKKLETERDNKPQLDHIQTDFVPSSVLSVPTPHKSTGQHFNGVVPCINITSNPLANETDKILESTANQVLHSDQSYHQALPTSTPTTLQRQDYQSPNIIQQHSIPVTLHQIGIHPNLMAQFFQQPQTQTHATSMDPMDLHCQTLEHNRHNMQFSLPTQPMQDLKMGIDGLVPPRIPSLRRSRRTSNRSNNNNSVGVPVLTGNAHIQRSPKTTRVVIKRNRLSTNNDNISSGSLNSIEV